MMNGPAISAWGSYYCIEKVVLRSRILKIFPIEIDAKRIVVVSDTDAARLRMKNTASYIVRTSRATQTPTWTSSPSTRTSYSGSGSSAGGSSTSPEVMSNCEPCHGQATRRGGASYSMPFGRGSLAHSQLPRPNLTYRLLFSPAECVPVLGSHRFVGCKPNEQRCENCESSDSGNPHRYEYQ
jgi:hypothetical protein